MRRISVNLILFFLVLNLVFKSAYGGLSIDVESGLAYNGYNDARIPGNAGTDISLTDDLKSESSQFLRVRLFKDLGERHKLIFLAAPLRFTASGTVNREIDFNGVSFAAGIQLYSKYRFDSYRISYQYTVINQERLRAGFGFTAKVRDASIQIGDGVNNAEKTNTGFVPLINFGLDWRFGSTLGLIIEGDALAAPQGRAEDVLVAIYCKSFDKLRLRLGYRVLEGGADNDEVYTFALVNYLSIGATWTF